MLMMTSRFCSLLDLNFDDDDDDDDDDEFDFLISAAGT